MTALISAQQRVISRPFAGDGDFWRIRQLAIDTYPITGLEFNWEIRRWDGRRFHDADTSCGPDWNAPLQLWETEAGQLVGVAHHEGSLGDAHLQLHPDYRHLEPDMIAWAEDYLSKTTDDGGRELQFFVWDYDTRRQRILDGRGYEKTPWGGVARCLRFGQWPVPEPAVPAGYAIRATRAEAADYDGVAAALNAAFNRDFHKGIDLEMFTTRAPSFRRDLDLVAIAPDGSIAAYVGTIYDETNRRALFEPVCTHPDHRRKGLGKALMFESLHRLKALGATEVTVATGDMIPANALYDSIGFTEAYQGHVWRKLW